MQTITEAYKSFWIRSFDFKGRTSRSDYWWSYLVIGIFYLLASFIHSGVLGLYLALSLVPMWSMSLRRLRDKGKSWQWMLIILIPIAGIPIWLFYFMTRPSASEVSSKELNGSFDQQKNPNATEKRLEELKDMFDRGILSNEEYQAMRKKTLGL